MKGSIYTSESCPVCRSKLTHDENRDGFTCKAHPNEHPVVIPKKCQVKFGRDIFRRFQVYREARQFLEGLRYKTVEGTFDARDYKQDNPLGFANQAERYLLNREDEVSRNHFRDIKCSLKKAINVWGQRNVKTISYGDIEDFLKAQKVSNKTRANIKSALLSFFKWLNKREHIAIPEFPEIKFILKTRNLVGINTQTQILEEVKRISYHINPRIWIGLKWLATYISIRPGELRHLREGNINKSGYFELPPEITKEKEAKFVAMIPEDIELYESIEPKGHPNTYFFRHIKGNGAAKPGSQFGKDYLYKWWKNACANLGLEKIDLYGGTRHSTATALKTFFTTHQIMEAGTMHKSNKAALRYIQGDKNASITIYSKVREMQEQKTGQVINFNQKKTQNKN